MFQNVVKLLSHIHNIIKAYSETGIGNDFSTDPKVPIYIHYKREELMSQRHLKSKCFSSSLF
ncbi:hypothetical protein DXA96_01320 [Lachnospiraceae bacterium OF09-33XD]|nr:hypothetical protein DXA96_01320 [Lachnospiraceae bacterium OF09-33XD]